jgi:hypothetical protein
VSEVWLDPDSTRDLASGCRTAAETAEGLRDDALAALTLAELTDSAGTAVLAELADELTKLARLLDLKADLMEYADVPANEGWLIALYQMAADAEDQLTDALDDDEGATRNEAAPFSLAGAVVPTDSSVWFHAMHDGCVAFPEGSGYIGGGVVIGPDGEEYPIVIPYLEIDGHVYTSDSDGSGDGVVASLGGADSGWTVVAYRSGIERIVEEPGAIDYLAAAAAGTTGLLHSLPPNDMLPGIVFGPDRPPSYRGDVSAPAALDPPLYDGELATVPVTMFVNGRIQQVNAEQLANMPRDVRRAAARLGVGRPSAAGSVVAGGADLAVTFGQGLAFAANLDNQSERAYQVIFEENEDGRRRARIETYSLSVDADGTVVIHPMHLFVNGDGELSQQPIEYAPYTEPVILDTSYEVAQGYELPWVTEVGDPEFPN